MQKQVDIEKSYEYRQGLQELFLLIKGSNF